MTRTSNKANSWTAHALCWHYFSVHFDEQHVELADSDETACQPTVTWAVGVLAGGDWEFLGAWPGGAVGHEFWSGVWADLEARDVDKISLVCASDPDARTLCPGTSVLPPLRRILGEGHASAASTVGVLRAEARRTVREASGVPAARIALECLLAGSGAARAAVLSPNWPEVLEELRPFYMLRPRRRALVRSGDEYLEQLGPGLCRAVASHGPFVDLAAAVSFVAQTISRDERRLKLSKLSGSARPRLRFVRGDDAGSVSLGY
ncbi:transposase [Paucibacter sp. PLA-PC-4]|uniref:transposase n=1 Tax=Paucibacter sp. PLA-PC-4 TaxID=2993655 RepID=UPI00224AA7F7|nr:transposase [Paucibacter sp. PLA-PC-4]MCX2864600.1 transposase [Paucibacter sp. PLA-PC-4]